MIQQQQQMVAVQQHQSFVRMASGDSIIHGVTSNGIMSPVSTVQSPLATLGGLASVQFPSTPTGKNTFRRESSTSTIHNVPALPFANTINVATHTNLGLNKAKSTPKTPSVASQDDNYTLNGIHITQFQEDDEDEDENEHEHEHDHDESSRSRSETSGSSSSIHIGDISNKDAINNMEPPINNDINKRKKRKKNYPKQKRDKGSKRKKLKELETKLLQNDDEVKTKVGDGLTPWDRFLDLMTPSFCTCSPNTNQNTSSKTPQ